MYKVQVIDGHNDSFGKLFENRNSEFSGFFSEEQKGHIDFPRARNGGLIAGIFSIFIPPPKSSPESDPGFGMQQIKSKGEITYSALEYEYAHSFVESAMESIRELEAESHDTIRVIKKFSDVTSCFQKEQLAIILHLEGAEAISPDLSDLPKYYEQGVRSLGPVWSRPNAFGYGVPFGFPHSPDTGPGLTRSGKALIQMCNRMGIIIDLSHMNLRGFRDVAGLSHAPLVVTHTNVYSLCQSSRNLTDEQIQLVGESKGVIGISFVTENINPKGTPDPDLPISSIVQQIDYVAQKIGVDYVAIGSDFDGAEMPYCLKDVSYLPDLIKALTDKGYDELSLEKIAFLNWLRVFHDTWKD